MGYNGDLEDNSDYLDFSMITDSGSHNKINKQDEIKRLITEVRQCWFPHGVQKRGWGRKPNSQKPIV